MSLKFETIPGVQAASLSASSVPMTQDFSGLPFWLDGQAKPSTPAEMKWALSYIVEANYLKVMGIPLKRGRDFTIHDAQGTPLVVIINESLARRYWPGYPNGPDPVGQHLVTGASAGGQIIGIVGDVRQAGLAAAVRPGLYRPCAQVAPQSAMFAVRTEGDPLRIVNSIRGQILSIDRDQPVSAVKTMDDVVEESEGQRRLIVTLLGVFAGAALLLVVVGIYGVIAYTVAQRTRELGIRRALGAQPRDILWLVAAQGLGLALAGVAIGVAGAVALTRMMKALLFEVSPTDPVTFVGVGALLVAVALTASLIPARRATRIDPMAALR